MSPSAIVGRALARGLDMIAITDHNTTRQVKVTQKIGRENGLFVLGGVEVTSQEETHCLCYFADEGQLDEFQQFLDAHLPPILRCVRWQHPCWRSPLTPFLLRLTISVINTYTRKEVLSVDNR